ncbi:MAG: hydantoinase/oxoprolinase family protein, partial [Halanaerobiaceae bacterium]|nr:hydantoinase/oxoprolinase family protein [Halanaerobiaceae bacterium]
MIIGIDVGGTHTDGVLLKRAADSDRRYIVVKTAKVHTERGNLLNSIFNILDRLTGTEEKRQIRRVVLSTTLAVNTILEEKYDPVALILIPGPGVNYESLKYGEENIILSAYINHRGKEVKGLSGNEIQEGLAYLSSRGIKNLAVVGKFSIRNPEQEKKVIEMARNSKYNFRAITAGHRLSGRLNFPRRVVTAYFNTAVTAIYEDFTRAVKEALEERGIEAGVFVLKCDGGTLPLDQSLQVPVQTVNSGPAASIMGTMALSRMKDRNDTAVVVDIGGTTTDIGLFIKGEPAFMPEGIEIDGCPTLVRGLFTVSIPIGGDSRIRIENGKLQIGPDRSGPAAAFGGPAPTPTDAFFILEHLHGNSAALSDHDIEASRRALSGLLGELDRREYRHNLGEYGRNKEGDILILARIIVELMTDKIVNRIRGILDRLQNRPVYTISELLRGAEIKPQTLLAMGGPAEVLLPLLAQKLQYRAELVPYPEVANAIGAAIASPTLTTTVRVDTASSYLDIVEEGIHRRLDAGEDYDLEEVEELARSWTRKRAKDENAEVEITEKE